MQDNPQAKGVYIAILNQGNIRAELSMLIAELTHQGKYRLYVSYPSEKPISNNRNQIVRDFLGRTEYDYLMMVDSDIVPPSKILDMIEYDVDIVGALCFAFIDGGVVPLVLKYDTDHKKKNTKPFGIANVRGDEGLVECDAVGTGCIVIKREVLEKIKAPFLNEYDENGIKTLGLDLAFCTRAKKLGFKVFCHLDFSCSHWTTLDLKEIYKAVLSANEIKLAKIREKYDKK